MRDRMFINKLTRHQGEYAPEGVVTPGGITDVAGGGGGGPVAPNAITDLATGQPDKTVTPGAITDMAGGEGPVAPNAITDGGTQHGIGEVARDVL